MTPRHPRSGAAGPRQHATDLRIPRQNTTASPELGAEACTSHSGNPQTLPLPASWTRSVPRRSPESSVVLYNMSEAVVPRRGPCGARASHGTSTSTRKHLHDERRHGRLARHDDRSHRAGDEVISTNRRGSSTKAWYGWRRDSGRVDRPADTIRPRTWTRSAERSRRDEVLIVNLSQQSDRQSIHPRRSDARGAGLLRTRTAVRQSDLPDFRRRRTGNRVRRTDVREPGEFYKNSIMIYTYGQDAPDAGERRLCGVCPTWMIWTRSGRDGCPPQILSGWAMTKRNRAARAARRSIVCHWTSRISAAPRPPGR